MSQSTDFKNLNILIPTELLSEIKIHAIKRNQFSKDAVLALLQLGLECSNQTTNLSSNLTADIPSPSIHPVSKISKKSKER